MLNRGDICVRDFRRISSDKKENKEDEKEQDSSNTKLRIVSLNMEMGKQINKIMSALKSLNADIILLQEVDISNTKM